MDAITLLKKDHKTVEELFKRFEKLGPRAVKAKEEVAERIITELSVHAFVEETILYPAIRKAIDQRAVTDLVLESLEEHHIVKWTLSELDKMRGDNERYSAKVTVLMESVRHHVEEEEDELFPKIEKAMGGERLAQIGDAMAEAKKRSPTHPHPRQPDEPPGNLLAAPAAVLLDKARDAGRKLLGTTAPTAAKRTPTPAKKATARKTTGASRS